MKKNLKKLFALLLVVVMVAAMFAGCANNAEKPAETVTPSEDTNTCLLYTSSGTKRAYSARRASQAPQPARSRA